MKREERGCTESLHQYRHRGAPPSDGPRLFEDGPPRPACPLDPPLLIDLDFGVLVAIGLNCFGGVTPDPPASLLSPGRFCSDCDCGTPRCDPLDPLEPPRSAPLETPRSDPLETPRSDPLETPRSDPLETPRIDPLETPRVDPLETPRDRDHADPAAPAGRSGGSRCGFNWFRVRGPPPRL